MSEEELEVQYVEAQHVEVNGRKEPNKDLALVLLGIVTLVAVSAIAIALVAPMFFHGVPEIESEVLSSLVTLATLGVGALAALLGGRKA